MTQKRSPSAATPKKKPPRRAPGLGMAAGGALVLMALALGWLFWFQAQRSSPMSPEALIAQAAEAYWQSGDVGQAQERLAGLEADRLAQLLAKMDADAPDEPTRQRLAALREALQLPLVTPSLWDSLLSQKLVLVSLAVAALPLLGALSLSLLPAVQRVGRQMAFHPPAAPETMAKVAPVDAPAEAIDAQEQLSAGPRPATESAPSNPPPAQSDPSQPVAEPHIQELLSGVFEGEASAFKYEVLLRELEDIHASDLLAACRQVAQQLRARSASPEDGKEG